MPNMIVPPQSSSDIVSGENASDAIEAAIQKRGWAALPESFYGVSEADRRVFQIGYRTLNVDPYGDARRRAYVKLKLDRITGAFERAVDQTYSQTYAANIQDGGKVRIFDPLSETMFSTTAFQRLITANLSLMLESFEFAKPELTIGIHAVRYYTELGKPTFSSPIWLHKDDEPVVLLNVIDESEGLVGGDTILAQNLRSIERVIHLKPFEGVVLTKQLFHMVTPMEAPTAGAIGFRDILLTTLEEPDDVVRPLSKPDAQEIMI